MKKNFFLYLDDVSYYLLKILMNLLKYLLFFVILFLAGFFFLHSINPVGVENFVGAERDIPIWRAWNEFKNIFNIFGGICFFIVLTFSIFKLIKEKLYLQRKKYILYVILFVFTGPILLLPIVLVKENKQEKYRRFRLLLYFYSLLIFLQASWFIGGAFGDILILLSYGIANPQ